MKKETAFRIAALTMAWLMITISVPNLSILGIYANDNNVFSGAISFLHLGAGAARAQLLNTVTGTYYNTANAPALGSACNFASIGSDSKIRCTYESSSQQFRLSYCSQSDKNTWQFKQLTLSHPYSDCLSTCQNSYPGNCIEPSLQVIHEQNGAIVDLNALLTQFPQDSSFITSSVTSVGTQVTSYVITFQLPNGQSFTKTCTGNTCNVDVNYLKSKVSSIVAGSSISYSFDVVFQDGTHIKAPASGTFLLALATDLTGTGTASSGASNLPTCDATSDQKVGCDNLVQSSQYQLFLCSGSSWRPSTAYTATYPTAQACNTFCSTLGNNCVTASNQNNAGGGQTKTTTTKPVTVTATQNSGPGGTCTDNSDCSTVGYICGVNGQCVQNVQNGPCETSGDCAYTGETCVGQPNGKCVDNTIGGFCDSVDYQNDECPEGSTCTNNVCQASDTGSQTPGTYSGTITFSPSSAVVGNSVPFQITFSDVSQIKPNTPITVNLAEQTTHAQQAFSMVLGNLCPSQNLCSVYLTVQNPGTYNVYVTLTPNGATAPTTVAITGQQLTVTARTQPSSTTSTCDGCIQNSGTWCIKRTTNQVPQVSCVLNGQLCPTGFDSYNACPSGITNLCEEACTNVASRNYATTGFPIATCSPLAPTAIVASIKQQDQSMTFLQIPTAINSGAFSYCSSSDETCYCSIVQYTTTQSNQQQIANLLQNSGGHWPPSDNYYLTSPPATTSSNVDCTQTSDATITASITSGGTPTGSSRIIAAGQPVTITGQITRISNQCNGYQYSCETYREQNCKFTQTLFKQSLDYSSCPKQLPVQLAAQGATSETCTGCIVSLAALVAGATLVAFPSIATAIFGGPISWQQAGAAVNVIGQISAFMDNPDCGSIPRTALALGGLFSAPGVTPKPVTPPPITITAKATDKAAGNSFFTPFDIGVAHAQSTICTVTPSTALLASANFAITCPSIPVGTAYAMTVSKSGSNMNQVTGTVPTSRQLTPIQITNTNLGPGHYTAFITFPSQSTQVTFDVTADPNKGIQILPANPSDQYATDSYTVQAGGTLGLNFVVRYSDGTTGSGSSDITFNNVDTNSIRTISVPYQGGIRIVANSPGATTTVPITITAQDGLQALQKTINVKVVVPQTTITLNPTTLTLQSGSTPQNVYFDVVLFDGTHYGTSSEITVDNSENPGVATAAFSTNNYIKVTLGGQPGTQHIILTTQKDSRASSTLTVTVQGSTTGSNTGDNTGTRQPASSYTTCSSCTGKFYTWCSTSPISEATGVCTDSTTSLSGCAAYPAYATQAVTSSQCPVSPTNYNQVCQNCLTDTNNLNSVWCSSDNKCGSDVSKCSNNYDYLQHGDVTHCPANPTNPTTGNQLNGVWCVDTSGCIAPTDTCQNTVTTADQCSGKTRSANCISCVTSPAPTPSTGNSYNNAGTASDVGKMVTLAASLGLQSFSCIYLSNNNQQCYSVCGKDYNSQISAAPTCSGGNVKDFTNTTYACGAQSCGGYANHVVTIQVVRNGQVLMSDTTTTDANGQFSYTFTAPDIDDVVSVLASTSVP